MDEVDRAQVVAGATGDDAARIAAAARELAEETGVAVPLDAARFVFAGRSITPEWAPLRFDAAYFLVEAPPGAEPDPSHAGDELDAGEWITPREALARYSAGERLTSPVVIDVIRALVPGLSGAVARMVLETEREERESRLWDLVPGVGMSMLRTPTLPPATHTNVYVIGGRELVVVDPASPYPEEQAALDAALERWAGAGRRVREIWLTHHHVDHVGGAQHLAERTGAIIAAHPRTAELLAGRVTIDKPLADGHVEVFPAEGAFPERRLRCVFTPGHAQGHHVFFEETTRFAIAGDMVAGIGSIVVDPDEGDMRAYLDSLARMAALEPRALLPAHGPVITDAAGKLAEYTRHRLWREELVFAELRRRGHATPLELVPGVYTDVAPLMHPLAARSLLAHLVKLVKDGRVQQEGDRFSVA